jgi:hypothetical protein
MTKARLKWFAVIAIVAYISHAQTLNSAWETVIRSSVAADIDENIGKQNDIPRNAGPSTSAANATDRIAHEIKREKIQDTFNANYLDTQRTLAKYSIYQFWVIGLTAILALWSAWESRRQAITAFNAYLSTHRPRLVLREAYTAPDRNGPITVTFIFTNSGGTAATVVGSKAEIFFSTQGRTKRQVSFDDAAESNEAVHLIPPGQKIEAGSFYEASCATPATNWEACNYTDATLDEQGRKTVFQSAGVNFCYYFYGKVLYEDATGVNRAMAFYRILDFDSYRFVPFGDAQLEYSDE